MRKILYVIVAFVVLLFIASAMTNPDEGSQLDFSSLAWIAWSLVAVVLIYGAYSMTSDSDAWEVGTRQVVFMGTGAALYGIFAWLFNASVIVLPSISLVSIRPAIAIPVFFGYMFGPVVGFFTGAVGNLLGDFLSGWGVFPTWDIGNGLIGFVAGLAMVYRDREGMKKKVLWAVAILTLVVLGLLIMNPEVTDTWTGELADFSGYIWVLVVAGVLAIGATFLVNVLGEDTAAINLWGSLGIIIGIGYAAIGDIWVSGYSLVVTMVGQFIPAAGPNIINSAILAPILLVAYKAVTARTGR